MIWHGTASIEAICAEGKLLFDPFVPLKHAPVKVRLEEFDGFSHIFITHCHIDHVTDLPRIVKRNPEVIIHGTQVTYDTMLKKGIPGKNLALLRYGDQCTVNGFTVRVYHGKHAILPKADWKRIWSWIKSPARWNMPHIIKEFIACQEQDETVFYQLEADGKTVSLMGSMNLRDDVTYPIQADLLVLPYNGWEDNLPPALSIIDRLQPQRILLDHCDDTFPPLTSSVDLSSIIEKNAGLTEPMQLRKVEHI